ncbi:peptidase [Fusibacter sp. A1]|nr:zinc metallopeptidase [Fusibacter sp. A1]RXV62843.1 peptidase [Fusibacter sp. A1]
MYLGYGMSNPIVLVLVFGTFIWAMIAQQKVKSAYRKYGRIGTQRGLRGHDVARFILDNNGLRHVKIESAQGMLSDHYDPKKNVVRLSPGVHDGNSIASVSIAAHEVGHAIQHAENYGLIGVRNALLPAAVASSKYVGFLFLAGYLISRFAGGLVGGLVMDAAILLFFGAVLFQAITLPVEFDASKRAKLQLTEFGIVNDEETAGVKRMLSAAAMTYVAALAVAIAQLIRMLMVRNRD